MTGKKKKKIHKNYTIRCEIKFTRCYYIFFVRGIITIIIILLLYTARGRLYRTHSNGRVPLTAAPPAFVARFRVLHVGFVVKIR